MGPKIAKLGGGVLRGCAFMTRVNSVLALGVVPLAIACGGSPEPPATVPAKAEPASEKAAPPCRS